MPCPHQSLPPGKDTGRRLCSIGNFNGKPWIGNCSSCRQTLGPGAALKVILAQFGLKSTPGCPCDDHAAEMDRRGSAWCAANIPKISGWLASEAARRHFPFSRRAASALIRSAIRKSDFLQAHGRPPAEIPQK